VSLEKLTRAEGIAYEAVTKHGASQIAQELADAYLLVEMANPKTVVEIGCDYGGTLWVWRQLAKRVIGVTLRDNTECDGRPLIDHGCEIVFGDSHAGTTIARLRRRLAGDPIDVLVIDGDHSWEGIQQDYEMYAPLVGNDGLILVHDVAQKSFPDVGKFFNEYCDGFIIQHGDQPAGWGVIGNYSLEEINRMVDKERVKEAVEAMRDAQARFGRNTVVISIEQWLEERGYDLDGNPVEAEAPAQSAKVPAAEPKPPAGRQSPKREKAA
jgi:predicted O-methyltransferase YrrM